MKKKYHKPKIKICYVYGEAVLESELIQVSVHTDDPQPPGGALADENNLWDTDVVVSRSVWEE